MQPTALSLTRIIRAPREKVFAAWTEPELLDAMVGSRPGHLPGGRGRSPRGRRLSPRQPRGRRLHHLDQRPLRARSARRRSWCIPWNVSILPGEPTLVRVTFLPHPDGTELTVVHERFAVEAVRDMHLHGWGGCIDKLEAMLAA